MGIKSLIKMITEYAGKEAIKTYKFSRFNGLKISVDASLIIYQTVIAMRSSGKDLKNKKGELTSHLQGLFYKILIFLQNGITPIFVFDGKPPSLKNKTIESRKKIKTDALKKIEEINDSDDEEHIKNFQKSFSPSKENMEEAKILLELMGIPFIQAPGEADIVCTWLAVRKDENGKRYVKGVCSDDSDMLVFGAPYLFKDMARFMKKNKDVKVVSLRKTLKAMDISMKQFVDLCVLLENDYCDHIKGVGYKTAYNLIKKHKSLEKVLSKLEKEKGEIDTQCFYNTRNYFKNSLDELDNDDFTVTENELELKKFKSDELIDFLCCKHNFDTSNIKNGLEKLEQYNKKLNVTLPNKSKYTMTTKKSENYLLKSITEEVDFISTSEDDSSDHSEDTKDKKIFVSKKKYN